MHIKDNNKPKGTFGLANDALIFKKRKEKEMRTAGNIKLPSPNFSIMKKFSESREVPLGKKERPVKKALPIRRIAKIAKTVCLFSLNLIEFLFR